MRRKREQLTGVLLATLLRVLHELAASLSHLLVRGCCTWRRACPRPWLLGLPPLVHREETLEASGAKPKGPWWQPSSLHNPQLAAAGGCLRRVPLWCLGSGELPREPNMLGALLPCSLGAIELLSGGTPHGGRLGQWGRLGHMQASHDTELVSAQ